MDRKRASSESNIEHRPKRSHQMLGRYYGLNKSYTKKLLVGLEYESITDRTLKPVVRLVGDDNDGVSFSMDSWKKFISTFETTAQFFNEANSNLLDQAIQGDGWSLRFTTCYSSKAIVVEDTTSVDLVSKKKFKHCLVCKEITFRNLENLIPCVKRYLDLLNKISLTCSAIPERLINFLYDKITSKYDSQLLMFEMEHVRGFRNFSDDDFDVIRLDTTDYLKEEAKDLILELYNLNMNDIVNALNERIK